jgi:hypothetical protein
MAFFNLSPAAVLGLTSGISGRISELQKASEERQERLQNKIDDNAVLIKRATIERQQKEGPLLSIGKDLVREAGGKLDDYDDESMIELARTFKYREKEFEKYRRRLSKSMFVKSHISSNTKDGVFTNPYIAKPVAEEPKQKDDLEKSQGFFEFIGDVGKSITGEKQEEQLRKSYVDSSAKYADLIQPKIVQLTTDLQEPTTKMTLSEERNVIKNVVEGGKLGQYNAVTGILVPAPALQKQEQSLLNFEINSKIFLQTYGYGQENSAQAVEDILNLAKYIGYLESKPNIQSIILDDIKNNQGVKYEYWNTLDPKTLEKYISQNEGLNSLLEKARQFLGSKGVVVNKAPGASLQPEPDQNNQVVKKGSLTKRQEGRQKKQEQTSDQPTRPGTERRKASRDAQSGDITRERFLAASQDQSAAKKLFDDLQKEDMLPDPQKYSDGTNIYMITLPGGDKFRIKEIGVGKFQIRAAN